MPALDRRAALTGQCACMTYTLPAIGAPAARPLLPKVAVEEHFNVLAAAPGSAQQMDLSRLVASMGYDRPWMSLVDARLVEFDERVAAMDAAGVDVSLLSHTVPGRRGSPTLAGRRRGARHQRRLGGRGLPPTRASPGSPASPCMTPRWARASSSARSPRWDSRAR